MKKSRIALLAIVIGVAIVGMYEYTTRTGNQNTIPALSPRGGDANASSEFLNAQKAVQYYRDEIRQRPEVVKNYVELAQIFLQEARITANHHEYIPKAQSLLEEGLKREPENVEALVTKASLLMTLHQFTEAKEISGKVLKNNPYNAASYNTLIDACVELGEYEKAVTACDKLMSVRPDLRGYARVSYLRELHGDIAGAREAMNMAADAAPRGQEQRAWAFYNLGNLFLHEGKLDTAEFIYEGILEERPNYAYAMSGLAQVRMARGKSGEAITLLNKALETTPEHIFMEQLANIYRAIGQTDNARNTAALVLQSFEQHEKDGWNTDKEYATFCANQDTNLAVALTKAQNEYARRPDNIDVLHSYAWLLYKNMRSTEAIPYIEQAMRLNTRSSLLEYHAGLIYKAAGQADSAKAHLQQALAIDPFINGLYAHDARKTLASMNVLAINN